MKRERKPLRDRMRLHIDDGAAHALVVATASQADDGAGLLCTLGEIAISPQPPGRELPGTGGVWRVDGAGRHLLVRPPADGNPAQIVAVTRDRDGVERFVQRLRAGDRATALAPTQLQVIATRECFNRATEPNRVPQETFDGIVAALPRILRGRVAPGGQVREITLVDKWEWTEVAGWPGVRCRLADRLGATLDAEVAWVERAHTALLVDVWDDDSARDTRVALRGLNDLAAMAIEPLARRHKAPAVSHRQIASVIGGVLAAVMHVSRDDVLATGRGEPIRVVYALARMLADLTPEQTAVALGHGTEAAADREADGFSLLRGDAKLCDDLRKRGLALPPVGSWSSA